MLFVRLKYLRGPILRSESEELYMTKLLLTILRAIREAFTETFIAPGKNAYWMKMKTEYAMKKQTMVNGGYAY